MVFGTGLRGGWLAGGVQDPQSESARSGMRLMNYAILLWLRRRWFIRVIQDLKSGKCEELE